MDPIGFVSLENPLQNNQNSSFVVLFFLSIPWDMDDEIRGN